MGDHRTLYHTIIVLYGADVDVSRYRTLCRAFAAVDMDQHNREPLTSDSSSFAVWCVTGRSDPEVSQSMNQALLAAPEPVRYASKRATFGWSDSDSRTKLHLMVQLHTHPCPVL